MNNVSVTGAMAHLANQREYVKKQQVIDQREAAARSSSQSGIVDESMLVVSMRSVRYTDEAHAAADLADNAIEAGASNFHVVFKVEGSKIVEMAFIDDGSGIVKEFLPHATKWGGSSNAGRRNLFGRFGFGLPSASVNRSKAYDVYSRISGDEPFSAVTVDLTKMLEDVMAGKGVIPLPKVTERELPAWVQKYFADSTVAQPFPGGADSVRTVVVWRDFDNLNWPNLQQSSANFREHFGITYASWLSVASMVVDGKPVEPVDVLFTTPDYRWTEIPGFPGAEPQRNITFEAKDANGNLHEVVVRFSFLSSSALSAIPASEGRGRSKKIRMTIRKEYNGIFVTRHGRYIELVKPTAVTWDNYARQVGVALDFPPELDELFGVTPDKQSIHFAPSVDSLLEQHGVYRAFNALKAVVAQERAVEKAERDRVQRENDEGGESVRPSELVIGKVLEADVHRPRKNEEAREEAERNLNDRIKAIAEETGVPEPEIRKARERVQQARPYIVKFVSRLDQDPFYVPYMEGIQMVLEINTEHPWFKEVYDKLTAEQAEVRSALELFLWVLGAREIDATGDLRAFYRQERRIWSEQLATGLDVHPLIFHNEKTRENIIGDLDHAWVEDDEEVVPRDFVELPNDGE